ncbi:uncharacterized protein BCR38DRAFT_340868 [Pseudomassariella vexata]|uniref:MYND-type domain-containing protein n=1 Tax=Pseudomassariella vexata TaxID=1141098 RepID=A0A1Y2E0Q7_9PEZI|nr:uncharacterized protein BCR38DRAFT_340868 [Pseudomassariella vexata]ORY65131.1 hypothetical protein BCR38DRAFT_340868 [Pseudomassariella vexata]
MATTPSQQQPGCVQCGKSHVKMSYCPKCKMIPYCSRGCQRSDRKHHGPRCGRRPHLDPPQRLKIKRRRPFTHLDKGDWLYNRPVEDVYLLLLSAYRLRQEDNLRFSGPLAVDPWIMNTEPNLWGCTSSLEGFQIFLWYCRSRPGLLPPWWSEGHHRQVLQYAFCRRDWRDPFTVDFESKEQLWTKQYMHNRDPTMPLQLRAFSEHVYAFGAGRQNWTMAAHMEALLEQGDMAKFIDLMDTFGECYIQGEDQSEEGMKWHMQFRVLR